MLVFCAMVCLLFGGWACFVWWFCFLVVVAAVCCPVVGWCVVVVVAGSCFFGLFVFFGEFDPGSGRTLAACLTHASRTGLPCFLRGGLVANG